ncbi:MAG: hypothetical protein JWN85_2525 [Gammaproteobacteria bacterium]|nr:hypothetical protein [Gammaproteobacteria bacterium]
MSTTTPELARLLEHPAIWRGRTAARTEVLPTGFAALDECLPGKGWPRTGLIEILVARFGSGELYLLLPVLAALTCRPAARWCVWVAPPAEQKARLARPADKSRDFYPLTPFAPALAAHGVALERMLVVRDPSLWSFEQALGSGASDVAMAWARSPRTREIRRLQLAAERGKTLGVLFRPQRAAREPSPAVLRIALESRPAGVCVTLLKSRGGARGSIEVSWTPGWSRVGS